MSVAAEEWGAVARRLGLPETDAVAAAMVLDEACVEALDEFDALVLAIALQRRLTALGENMPAVAEAILARARLGAESRTRVAKAAERLTAARDQLAAATEGQAEAAAQVREAEELESRAAQLERDAARLRLLAQALPQLRESVAALESALAPADLESAAWEERLGTALVLARDRLGPGQEALRAELGTALREADEEAAKLAADRKRLEEITTRHSTAIREAREVRETLECHYQADRAVAAALPSAHSADASGILDQCGRLLETADRALRAGMEAHERTSRLPVLKPGGMQQ